MGIESGPGIVRYHSVTSAQGILHGPPRVIAGGRLDIPNIPGVSVKMTAFNCLCHRVLVADRTASGVHQPGTLLKVAEKLIVDQPTGSLVKRSVDRDNVALGDKFLLGFVSSWVMSFMKNITSRSVIRFAPTAAAAATIPRD